MLRPRMTGCIIIANKMSLTVGRFLISPHKDSWVCVSSLTQSSPNDSAALPDTCQTGVTEGKAPWYITLLKEKVQQDLSVGGNTVDGKWDESYGEIDERT